MQDPFRPKYRELKHSESTTIANLKADAFALLQQFPVGAPNAAIARQKLEEAVMWAVKDITA